ncbi:putative baseplate assembly protein [Amycolatopsis sp. NPDC059027]|uniref:putative baseplate assembly protein n=1 Tax=Amycolatopsis sp. NPDC059027 TaxID=3346709 RepID=UPI00366B5A55
MTCTEDRRITKVRHDGYNGIDTINADQDQLTVIFFGKAPEELKPENFRIEGGRRVTGIRVTNVKICAEDDPELEDRVILTVDRPGDLSEYRLRVVESDGCGQPGTEPYPGFDPRYACLGFTFARCDDIDCGRSCDCPQKTYDEPEIDYLAKDYASFRQLLLDRLTLITPRWTERHAADIGVTLVELLAYEGDRLSYLQDAVATEAYLDTARERVSIRRHTRLVDYPMHDGCAARTWVCVDTTEDVKVKTGDFRFVTLPDGVLPGRPALSEKDMEQRGIPPHEVFEPVGSGEVVFRPRHYEIDLWTWGDIGCCLPEGATSATLVDSAPGSEDRILCLAPGDVLVFEEIAGAKTGNPADADHTHCQAVRLTSVCRTRDELYCKPLLEVEWAIEDALTFPLCINAKGGPKCADIKVGVARGNAVLVEHGKRFAETLDPVEGPPAGEPGCPDPVCFGCPGDPGPVARPAYPPLTPKFAPALGEKPVTQSVPFPAPADVGHAQARRLAGVPDRARDRLREILRDLPHHGGPSTKDVEYLTTLFGAAVLHKLDLTEHPRRALRTLLARFGELLARKLERLDELIRRAHSGRVLGAEDIGWEIGQSWGQDEGEKLDPARQAFHGPAIHATRTDPRAALPAIRLTGKTGDVWSPRRDLLDSGPADRHFVGETDDDTVMTLRFGDGRNGAIPAPGTVFDAHYRVGNGVAGNVGRGVLSRIVFGELHQGGIRLVRNPLPATGGTEPEPVAEVRQRAPLEVRHRLLRAITADDYARLAETVPGIQRAAGDLRWTGSWYEAQVAIDPLGAEVAPDRLLDQVRGALRPYRRIGHDLSVATATLVPIHLGLCVEVRPDFIAGHVRAAVLRALVPAPGVPARPAPLFHPDNLTFGTPVRVSRVVAAAAAVPGVRSVRVTRLHRLFGMPGDALERGLLAIRPLEVAQLDNDRSRPENGRIDLEVRGGR